MKAGFYALFLFFAVTTHFSANAQGNTLVKDLHNDWLVFDGSQYIPFARAGNGQNTVYFKVDGQAFPGMHLSVSSPAPFSVFVNGQLSVQSRTTLNLSIDSLTSHYGASLLQLAIHQRKINAEGLFTAVVAKEVAPAFGETLIPNRSAFRDFAIIGIMVLLAMIIVIIKLNPKLAADYFSLSKIFSLREAEDGPSKSRITNSINILFYAYSSLMLGYFLMIVYHFLPHEYPTALHFQPTTFRSAMLDWAALSLIVLALFFGKIVMVYGLSYIFGMKEVGSVHFFNWVRLLVGVFGVLTVIVFFYFIMRGTREGFYDFLLHAVAWVFAGWMILIILKLQRQLQHSMFHLFSYICATELIPFLITVKVLYY